VIVLARIVLRIHADLAGLVVLLLDYEFAADTAAVIDFRATR